MSHNWVNGEDLIICGGCDTRRGSRASLKPCPAAPAEPVGMYCEGCGLTRDPYTGQFCNWCEGEMLLLAKEGL